MKEAPSGRKFKNIPAKLKMYGQRAWQATWERRKYILYGLLGIVLLHLILVVVFIVAINKGAFGPMPDEKQLESIENPVAAEIFTADSVLMGKYYLQNRLDLKKEELTPEISNALIATEDIRFYNHNGIDVKSLFRVLFKTILLQKEGSGGGSTITQQLAKNLYPRQNYPIGSIVINKLREMVIAVKLEKLYSKDEILMLYLNTVPFGEDTYGIKTGALRYFRKAPRQLNTEEIAMLVGMLKGTSVYNPRTNYEKALNRRNVVLLQMYRYGMLSETTKDSLAGLPVKLNYYRPSTYAGVAPYFRVQVQKHTKQILQNINEERGTDYDLYTDGLKVYTTVNSRMQSFAEAAVTENMKELQQLLERQWKDTDITKLPEFEQVKKIEFRNAAGDSINKKVSAKIFDWDKGGRDTLLSPLETLVYNMKMLQTGFVAMDVKSGEIKAWVGGIDHEFYEYDHVTAPRQVGSTFKPFLYLAALESGYSPCDYFKNERYSFSQFDNWSPGNSDEEYGGMYSLQGALTHSVNTISAKLISDVGISRVTNMAHRAGIRTELPDVPSLALGTAELPLIDLISGYQTIANKGVSRTPKFIKEILNIDGDVIYRENDETGSEGNLPASEKNLEIMIQMLRNVVNHGTAARLRYKYGINTDVAGKTGTTQDYADGWFVGFTPDIIAGAWVGAEYPMVHFRNRYGQGANTALPVWAGFFNRLYRDKKFKSLKNSWFDIDDSIPEMLKCQDYIEPPEMEIIDKKQLEEVADASPKMNDK